MEELIKLAKEKGFQPKTVTTKYTVDVILGSRKNILVNDTCNYLVLCEIQKWIREVHNIDVRVSNRYRYYCLIKDKQYFDGTTYDTYYFFSRTPRTLGALARG